MTGDADGEPQTTSGRQASHARIRRLELTTAALSVALMGTVAWVALRPPPTPEVLAVERLEVLEPDGQPAFALASSSRPAVATMDGDTLLADQTEERRSPHFIFFDGHGDEVGGMTFENETTGDGFSATRHISLDGYKQDQTVVLHHYQDTASAHSGLSVSARPRELSVQDAFRRLGLTLPATREELDSAIAALPEESRPDTLRELFGATRLFVGSNRDDEAVLELRDGDGRPRIVIGAPEEGPPYFRVLDRDGAVVEELLE